MVNQDIEYEFNIHMIKIVKNIMKKQLPHLIDTISIKENICHKSLMKCVNKFNEEDYLDDRLKS